jgi:penicillin-binding protein 1C
MRMPGGRIAISAIAIAAALLVRCWPRAPLSTQIPLSTAVWSADGELLRVTRADDDQFRLWTPIEHISPSFVDAVLLKEDRWFAFHPGVSPVSIARAAFRTYRGKRQGGSTITMQLARMLYRLNTRTARGKARQIVTALWLEARYSKHDLLEAYLNVVPFGGNTAGVGAASQLYFSKPPDALTLGEAITLAVIPQRPGARAGRGLSDVSLLDARTRLARLWLAHRDGSPDVQRELSLPIVARPRDAMPHLAPHFVDALLAAMSPATGRIETTLDMRSQRLIERQIARYIEQYGDRGVHNIAALLVDTHDMAVRAWVGSADYWSEAIDGQVDGVLAKRSPGSTLKPFVYALAIDQGILHPQTVLRDLPSSFGPFSPENFDGRFFGPISAETALIRSRNVPAVWVSNQLKQPTLYQFLQSVGIRQLRSESYYGLALALGDGDLTMEEIAGLYAMLANGGELRPLRTNPRLAPPAGVRLISPEASFITLDMLRHNQRPDADGVVPSRLRWPVAWKTGTSWGFRDAWTAGVAGPYALVVWIGDFRGQGNPAFVGIDAAAPLFFRIADALNLSQPDAAVPPSAPPAGVRRVAVCVDSGDLPNADCPHTVDTWYIPGKSPIRVSQLHRAVALDAISGRAVCPPYAAGTRIEVFEFWPSDMLRLFRQAGMPRRTPPAMPECASTDGLDPPRITSPVRNVSYAVGARASDDTIALEATTAGDVRSVFWFDGSAFLGQQSVAEGALSWQPASPGIHLIRAVDDHGRSAERDVEVRLKR